MPEFWVLKSGINKTPMTQTRTFILSTGAMNTRRIIVPTDSIDTVSFMENPVMLYNHERGQVIGRWDNVRVENGKLLGDAVFDDEDEAAKKIKGKVERGFIKAASIGIRNVEAEELSDKDGEYYRVTSCELREASIVDIPANRDALLVYNDRDEAVNLGSEAELKDVLIVHKNKILTMKKRIAAIMGLGDAATEEELEVAVKHAFSDSQELKALKKQMADSRKAKAVELTDAAIADGKLGKDSRGTFLELAETNFDLFEKTIGALPKPIRLSDVVGKNKPTGSVKTGERKDWKFSDYQKKDPAALSKMYDGDREAFMQLYDAEFK